MRIVVVDDSVSLQRMISAALGMEGFDVTTCGSGSEAVSLLQTSGADVVVTDLNMPDIDGVALTRQIRSLPKTARCPVLILTTDNSEARKQQARAAGANGWVRKPFESQTLVRAIRAVASRMEAAR